MHSFFFNNKLEDFHCFSHTLNVISAPFCYCRWHVTLQNLCAAVRNHIAMMKLAHYCYCYRQWQDCGHCSIIVTVTILSMTSGSLSLTPLILYKVLHIFVLHFTHPCRLYNVRVCTVKLHVVCVLHCCIWRSDLWNCWLWKPILLTIHQHQFYWFLLIILRPMFSAVFQSDIVHQCPLTRRHIRRHLGSLSLFFVTRLIILFLR